jgi:hypothetical protein
MSIDPIPRRGGNIIRQIITGFIGVLAVICLVWIAFSKLSPGNGGEAGLDSAFSIMGGFFAIDVLALIALGVWILRPPVPGAVSFLGRWAGKLLLFLGLGLAVVIFLFATCLGILA